VKGDLTVPILIGFSIVQVLIYSLLIVHAWKTKGFEKNHRWKASIAVGLLFVFVVLVLAFSIAISISIKHLIENNFEFVLSDVISYITETSYSLFCLINLALLFDFFYTLRFYYQSRREGDYIIDKYWKNPRIHDNTDKKYLIK
jgi:protein-S-isoprenylcysteine O-methyltransferase Ste14